MNGLTVASYLMGIPPGNTNPEKPRIINDFIKGVNACGDRGAVVTGWHPMNTDVAVIQGFVHANSKDTRHLRLRKQVYENQILRNKRCVIVDSNLFLSFDPGNTKTYLRYSFDGVFPTTGEYCYDNPNPYRWEKLSKDLNIKVKPWRKPDGGTILLCCQRDGGWSMDSEPVVSWIVQTVTQVRHYTDKQIVVRFHPGDKNVRNHIRHLARYKIGNLRISNSENIFTDFATACAVVNHNSSPAVASVIEGIPTFQTDVERSQAKDVVHSDLKYINEPKEFEREGWLHKLAQCHWTLDEVAAGEAWRHMRKWAVKE